MATLARVCAAVKVALSPPELQTCFLRIPDYFTVGALGVWAKGQLEVFVWR